MSIDLVVFLLLVLTIAGTLYMVDPATRRRRLERRTASLAAVLEPWHRIYDDVLERTGDYELAVIQADRGYREFEPIADQLRDPSRSYVILPRGYDHKHAERLAEDLRLAREHGVPYIDVAVPIGEAAHDRREDVFPEAGTAIDRYHIRRERIGTGRGFG